MKTKKEISGTAKAFNEAGQLPPVVLPDPMSIWKLHCWFDQAGVKHCRRHWVPT
jgi:hypothetical protein